MTIVHRTYTVYAHLLRLMRSPWFARPSKYTEIPIPVFVFVRGHLLITLSLIPTTFASDLFPQGTQIEGGGEFQFGFSFQAGRKKETNQRTRMKERCGLNAKNKINEFKTPAGKGFDSSVPKSETDFLFR